MKKLALALLLLLPTTILAEKPSTNPADYPIIVHVVCSHYNNSAPLQIFQLLDVVIDGQQMELQSEGNSGVGVLALGDYHAQLYKNNFIPKKLNGYDIFVVYRFLFPDGNIRDFDVVGLGPKADSTVQLTPTNP
jgi:hypothetical protein